MQTYRRLNDGVRYYGLTIRGLIYVGLAAALIYLVVRISPLSFRPTLTITLFMIGPAATMLYVVSGNAMSPDRYLAAVFAWRTRRRFYDTATASEPRRGGVVVDAIPKRLVPEPAAAPEWEDELDPSIAEATAR